MDERECQNQAARIETLIQEIATFPEPRAREKMEELLHALLTMYGAGLTKMVETIARSATTGQALLETLADDELVGSLLLLHDLHPVDLNERVQRAVEKAQSAVQARGGVLELTRVEKGTAFLRLTGSCQGCGASAQALKQMVEKALYNAVPDLDTVSIAENTPQKPVTAPVKFLPRRTGKPQTVPTEQMGEQEPSPRGQASISGTR